MGGDNQRIAEIGQHMAVQLLRIAPFLSIKKKIFLLVKTNKSCGSI